MTPTLPASVSEIEPRRSGELEPVTTNRPVSPRASSTAMRRAGKIEGSSCASSTATLRGLRREEEIRIPGGELEIALPLEVEEPPISAERAQQRGLSALPRPEDGHAREMPEVFAEQRFISALHGGQYRTISLEM